MIGFIVGMFVVCTVLYFWISFLTKGEEMSIEGIPEGWELVRIGMPIEGEHYLGMNGKVLLCEGVFNGMAYIIVRKIEKPKQFRAFDDPAEASSLLGEKLRLKVDHKNMGLFIGITSHGFQIGLSHWTPEEAFRSFERLDGTPFGVECEVTE